MSYSATATTNGQTNIGTPAPRGMNTNRPGVPDDIQIDTAELPEAIAYYWSAGLIPCIHSAPGMGKSQIVRQAAEAIDMELVTIRLAQREPTSIAGMPFPDRETKTVEWFIDKSWPTHKCVLFGDELNRAPALIQNAFFQVLDERRLGSSELHPETYLVIAVNDEQDGGGVVRMPQALKNRVVHIYLKPSARAWVVWAIDAGLAPEVIAYISNKGDALYQYHPTADAWQSSRTWEMVSKVYAQQPPRSLELPLIAGCIGRTEAIDFLAFARAFRDMPDLNSIRLNPQTAPVPTAPNIRYQTAYFIAQGMDDRSARPFIEYLERLPEEVQVFAMKLAEFRTPALGTNAAVTNWKNKHIDAL